MALTRAELAEALCEELGLNGREAKELVDVFFEEVKVALEGGELVRLSGFGKFTLRDKRERPGRNPKTGEEGYHRGAAGGDVSFWTEAEAAGRGLCWNRQQVGSSCLRYRGKR